MFNFHTHHIDEVPCLLSHDVTDGPSIEEDDRVAGLSVGLHPWRVGADWREKVALVRSAALSDRVWAIGECGLDKVRGGSFSLQQEAFRAQMLLAEELQKPVVIHCVKAFDELLALRQELVRTAQKAGHQPQPWVVHGFRGNPHQAKQLMTKGLLFSFGHQYNLETLRWAFAAARTAEAEHFADSGQAVSADTDTARLVIHPFFLETDDFPVSVRQIYEQAARHLGVNRDSLETLCDPRQTIFRHRVS